VWTGNEMVVWSGFVTVTLAEDTIEHRHVGSYQHTNAPMRGGFHTTVWTGREMIVWGGNS